MKNSVINIDFYERIDTIFSSYQLIFNFQHLEKMWGVYDCYNPVETHKIYVYIVTTSKKKHSKKNIAITILANQN